MKTPLRQGSSRRAASAKLKLLRRRLAESEEALRAVVAGEVDTVTVAGKRGPQVFTLHGAEHAYRVVIESMNEGALTLMADDKMILYANQCLARMVGCPLQQVTGSSFGRFLSPEDRASFRPLLKRADKAGAKIQVHLLAHDGSRLPVQISIRPLAKNGYDHEIFGMVVTDLTESRRTEELLRALTHRVVRVQEAERGRVALELHDNITQLLCAIIFRSQALADKLPVRDGSSKKEAMKLRAMLGECAEEVERIARDLRPSVLEQLGLVAALQATSVKFADRTGVSVKLACAQLTVRLSADAELALYRILQETLKNVEKHGRAHHVTVALTQQGDFVQLAINDDGVGFDVNHHADRRERKGVLGLLGMQERAAYVGGVFTVKSGLRAGTAVEVRIPLSPATAALN